MIQIITSVVFLFAIHLLGEFLDRAGDWLWEYQYAKLMEGRDGL